MLSSTDNWSKADNGDCKTIKIHEKAVEAQSCDPSVARAGFGSSVIQLFCSHLMDR